MRTPGYMREEMKRDKLRGRTARRAQIFEKRLEKGKRGRLARKCIKEKKEVRKRGFQNGKKERNILGKGIEDLTWKREQGVEMPGYEIEEKEREVQREDRRIQVH